VGSSIAFAQWAFPFCRGSKSIEVEKAATSQDLARGSNNSGETDQRSFVHFIPPEQIGIVGKIAKEPIEPPKSFRRALDPRIDRTRGELLRFKNHEAD